MVKSALDTKRGLRVGEKLISWRQAVQYGIRAKQLNWLPKKIEVEQSPTIVVVQLNNKLLITEMRDWVFSAVGQNHKLTGMFTSDEFMPEYLRFWFDDLETCMLFKLTWY